MSAKFIIINLLVGIVTMTAVSFFVLKEPLENKGIEGKQSIIIRIIAGILGGIVVCILLSGWN